MAAWHQHANGTAIPSRASGVAGYAVFRAPVDDELDPQIIDRGSFAKTPPNIPPLQLQHALEEERRHLVLPGHRTPTTAASSAMTSPGPPSMNQRQASPLPGAGSERKACRSAVQSSRPGSASGSAPCSARRSPRGDRPTQPSSLGASASGSRCTSANRQREVIPSRPSPCGEGPRRVPRAPVIRPPGPFRPTTLTPVR
eukprot:gnl/TRDRNA2_/TRDRNA2_162443_c2_seq1.p1 gnl/TRDRNA2_/TRDRNA2_162443_c2~~gnl/TRDRNA2_/TRDRNA2_162443_c2_seq1.p1  ORF type:complete len:216 (+),score=12.48 gnl/TRDRNA2_/TRDRNA2_162443_c2_seq1:53-649(+)